MKIYLDSPFLPAPQSLYDPSSGASSIGPLPVQLTVDFESAIPDIAIGSPVESRLPFYLILIALALLLYFALK